MGSGKSTAGKIIAPLLGMEFADTDRMVEEEEGMTISEIFAARGEEYFRRAESRALGRVAAMSGRLVACGGGTPCSKANMELMKATGVTVYLRLQAETLAARLLHAAGERPLLSSSHNPDSDKTRRHRRERENPGGKLSPAGTAAAHYLPGRFDQERASGETYPAGKTSSEATAARVRELLCVRSPWYEQADLVIDAEKMSGKEIAAVIEKKIRSAGDYLPE